MLKRYTNAAFIYAVIALISGVFYREFTKFSHFSGKTNLSVMHTHYFILGMFFFLLLLLLEKNFTFSDKKHTGKIIAVYHTGLNIAGIAFLLRGLSQVSRAELSKGLDASISGIAGIGHILLSVAMIMLLLQIRKKVAAW